MLGVKRLVALLNRVKSRFLLTEDCEITLEVNPGTVSFDDLKRLREAGFDRISVGIQSTDDSVLKLLGRIHSAKEGLKCLCDARKAGFLNISADVMFGLPGRTPDGLKNELEELLATGITHLSAYSLQLEEDTPLFCKKEELLFPDEEQEEEEYGILCKTLNDKGFLHYEISSFALPDFESRHNSGYWEMKEYFGFGAGAHSFFDGKRFKAKADLLHFLKCEMKTPFDPTDFYDAPPIEADELEEERIMLALRTSKGAVLKSRDQLLTAKRLADMGFGELIEDRFVLNQKGFRVSNEIIAQILE